MYRLLVDDHIPQIETFFSKDFIIETYHHNSEVIDKIHSQDILICRSSLQVDETLIQASHLKIVATASSGTNHIDHQALDKQGIPLVSGKGANAPAVCDYVTSCLAYLDSHHLIPIKKVAIIGFGAVGSRLYQRLKALGFELGVFDPYLSPPPPNAIDLSQLSQYPIICLHPNFHKSQPHPSYHLINNSNIHHLSEQVVIINAARGQVVEEQAILAKSFKGHYCCDVYAHEPHINPAIIARATLCTPHIAGHSVDSKKRITQQISERIHHLLNLPIHNLESTQQDLDLISPVHWQAEALALYNPEAETLALKHDASAEHFLALRKAHHHRRDFPWPI